MITWMQRHKKYLVVTIWISVIAFVGAGFVGFGSVNLNTSRAKYVAKVGDLGITYKEFQNKFNELFLLQSQFSNKELTQELALQLGLDNQAIASLIQNKLFLKYAIDLGFSASDDEIIENLKQIEIFKKEDGGFDKEKYFLFLKNIGLKANEFEEQIKNEIIVKKLFDILKIPASQKDLELLASSRFMEDEVKIKIIKSNKNSIKIQEDELKKYWQEHKNEYTSEQSYEYSKSEIKANLDLDEGELESFYQENKHNYKNTDGKIKSYEEAKESVKIDLGIKKIEKEANLKYIDLKKGRAEFKTGLVSTDNSDLFKHLKDLKVNEISKPFRKDDALIIVRLDKINQPKPLEYDAAKDLAKDDFLNELFWKKLNELGENEVAKETLDGKNIGFISKDSDNNTDLSDIEFFTFLNDLFLKNVKKSFVVLSDKVVVYEILSQKLSNDEKLKENTDVLKKEIEKIKQATIFNELLDELQKRYKVQIFYDKGRIN